MNNQTLTIGIPTYNSENTISALLDSLDKQNGEGYNLQKIVVYDDQSSDRTAELVSVRSRHVPYLKIVDASKRKGFAHAVQHLLTHSTSDITLLLNDDVVIQNSDFLQKIAAAFQESSNIGLVCANPRPYAPNNFVERAVDSGFSAYDRARRHIRQGNSSLTCDGKTMAFSRRFIQTFPFPNDFAQMGNVDTYMYCMCIQNHFEYRFIESATVGFKNPSTVADLTRWTLRNNHSLAFIREQFNYILDDDYRRVRRFFLYYKAAELIKNPLGCLLLFAISVACACSLRFGHFKFNPTWTTISSTKSHVETTS